MLNLPVSAGLLVLNMTTVVVEASAGVLVPMDAVELVKASEEVELVDVEVVVVVVVLSYLRSILHSTSLHHLFKKGSTSFSQSSSHSYERANDVQMNEVSVSTLALAEVQ